MAIPLETPLETPLEAPLGTPAFRFNLERCHGCGYWDHYARCCGYVILEKKPRASVPMCENDQSCAEFTSQRFRKTIKGKTTEVLEDSAQTEERQRVSAVDFTPSVEECEDFFGEGDFVFRSKGNNEYL